MGTSWPYARDEIGVGLGSAGGLRWFGWIRGGRRVHAGAGVPSVVTGVLWTVRGHA